MALSLDDVLSGAPRFRTKDVDYGSGLKFKLHSFDAPTFQEVMSQIRDETHSKDDKEDFYVSLAMRAISGQQFDPSPEQIKAFSAKLDKGVIQSLVTDWVAFNSGAEDLAAAAKKS